MNEEIRKSPLEWRDRMHLIKWDELPREILGHDVFVGNMPFVWHEPTPEEPQVVSTSGDSSCYNCGERVTLFTNGARIFTTSAACEYPDGPPPTVFELNVSSGKIVVANDLRSLFPCDEPKDSINNARGCRRMSLAYAAAGMAHAIVGNSCPGVFQDGDLLFVACGGWDSENDREMPPPVPATAVEVAKVITDLWWFSIADAVEFRRRVERFFPDLGYRGALERFHAKVVDVAPGVYEFTCEDPGDDDATIFARVRRVRGPDPVEDFLAVEDAKSVTPEQYIAQSAHNWPTLYSTSIGGIMHVANHVLCTIGNGVDWHWNGHPRIQLDADVIANPRSIEIPVFDGECRWYPMAREYSALSRAAGLSGSEKQIKLSPSWAKLAFNVLQCMIWHGVEPFQNDSSYVKQARETMRLAVEIYWRLVDLYPDAVLAYPEFAEWMMSNEEQLGEYCDVVELRTE